MSKGMNSWLLMRKEYARQCEIHAQFLLRYAQNTYVLIENRISIKQKQTYVRTYKFACNS